MKCMQSPEDYGCSEGVWQLTQSIKENDCFRINEWTDPLPQMHTNKIHTQWIAHSGVRRHRIQCWVVQVFPCNWGLHEEHYVFNAHDSLKSELCISLGHCRLPIIRLDLSDVSTSTLVCDVGCQGVGWADSCIILCHNQCLYSLIESYVHEQRAGMLPSILGQQFCATSTNFLRGHM